MATVRASVFVGPDDKVETFDFPSRAGRAIGLRIGHMEIQFHGYGTTEETHRAIVTLLDAVTELEAAANERLQDDAA